jgi:hypothetical protein
MLLVPLLTQGTNMRVFLTVNLANEKDELRTATDGLRGNVRLLCRNRSIRTVACSMSCR